METFRSLIDRLLFGSHNMLPRNQHLPAYTTHQRPQCTRHITQPHTDVHRTADEQGHFERGFDTSNGLISCSHTLFGTK